MGYYPKSPRFFHFILNINTLKFFLEITNYRASAAYNNDNYLIRSVKFKKLAGSLRFRNKNISLLKS